MPFESNYAEKSRQTNSKTFVKTVEEAMDEVSRRSALGLSCMCRSKQNFRKTDVEGYYAVDIADYEPGAVYSIDAIEKARAISIPLIPDLSFLYLQVGTIGDAATAANFLREYGLIGGLAPAGFNFDAKLRTESTDIEDLFIAHIAGMDTLARGLRNAAKLLEDGSLGYSSFDSPLGAQIEAGKADFELLEKKAMEWGEPIVPSGKQELAEIIFQSTM
ncbi:hypothetical protein LXL04_029960 [Taraxacum kok-saghyz]